jgi:hypothetical protein
MADRAVEKDDMDNINRKFVLSTKTFYQCYCTYFSQQTIEEGAVIILISLVNYRGSKRSRTVVCLGSHRYQVVSAEFDLSLVGLC